MTACHWPVELVLSYLLVLGMLRIALDLLAFVVSFAVELAGVGSEED